MSDSMLVRPICSRLRSDRLRLLVVAISLAASRFPVAMGLVVNAQEFEMTEQQFNSWICQTGGTPEENANADLERQMEFLDAACDLAPAQRAKLALAASVDVGRFLSRVDEMRTKIVGKKFDQNNLNEVYQQVAPLQNELQRGLVGRGSLFDKVRNSTLDSKQQDALDRIVYARAQRKYLTALKQFIVALDQSLALTGAQREGLFDLLFRETAPPSRFGQYDTYYILSQTAALPADRLADLLDEPQLRQFRRGVDQGRGYEAMLKQQGVTPLKEPAKPTDEVGDVK